MIFDNKKLWFLDFSDNYDTIDRSLKGSRLLARGKSGQYRVR